MPKVITLEKAADGSFVVPKNPLVEEVAEEIPYIPERTVVMPVGRYGKKRKTHEFIVKNGSNVAQFLDGVNKTIKTAMLLKKLIK